MQSSKLFFSEISCSNSKGKSKNPKGIDEINRKKKTNKKDYSKERSSKRDYN